METGYDFIVCGGGTSGPAIAARLAEDPSISVLLVEAGPDNIDLENTQMVGAWSDSFGTDLDWNLKSEPNPAAYNRVVDLSRGKFLGGSSAVNGTLIVRGARQDYDDWEAMGNPGWGSKSMWYYFKKSETFHGEPWFEADVASHGISGPIHTSVHPLAPISQKVLESFIDRGFPRDDDMFASGKRSHGCGHSLRTVWKGKRITGGDYLARAVDKTSYSAKNLKVLYGSLVSKVVLDDSCKVTGIQVLNLKTGARETIRCLKEVILSAGAYGSPQILLLSGIGPKEDLYEVDIQPRIDLPGVGRNLEDHLTVFVFYEVPQGLTTDHLVHGPGAYDKSQKEWRDERSGALSRSHFGIFAFARLDKQLEQHEIWRNAQKTSRKINGRDPMGLAPSQPHVEFFSTERYGAPKHFNNPPPIGRSAFANIVELFGARSRGYVKLRSSDPTEKPIIQHNYLSDPLDVLVLAEACKLGASTLMEGSGTKDLIIGSWPEDIKHHEYTELGQWEEYVKQTATTCFHPGGTCKMGPDSDPGAVVDARLRVRRVTGLRVADCSIMPKLNNGHTQAVAYAIGEKCADMVKEDWQLLTEGGSLRLFSKL